MAKIKYIGFWPRFGAHILDNILMASIPAILFISGAATIDFEPGAGIGLILLAILVWFVLAIANDIILVAKIGSSLGKRIVGIKIQDKKGKNLSYGTALVRMLVKRALFFFGIIGALVYVIPLWADKKEKKSLGDLAAKSFVVERK